MNHHFPHVVINGKFQNVQNRSLIAAYSLLQETGDAVVDAHDEVSGTPPGQHGHEAARIAYEGALKLDHEAKVLMAEAIRTEWVETGTFTLGECLQACEGLHVDEAILHRVVERQATVKAIVARLTL